MWPKTRVTDLLGIEVPIVQAVIASGAQMGTAFLTCAESSGHSGLSGAKCADPRYRQAAAKQNNPAFMSLWAGQASRLSKPLSASELMDDLVKQTEQILQEFRL